MPLNTDTALPKHVAIIMDGNGRWAQQLGRSRPYGHRAGHTAVLKTVQQAVKRQIASLTLFAFSSENWQRPQTEVSALMILFHQAIKRNRRLFTKHNIRFQVIGDTAQFSEKLQQAIKQLEAETADNTAMCLNIAANYGSKWDIVQATKQLAKQVENKQLNPDDITEQDVQRHLVLADQPPVDLLIRTGGEQRISNYLLWQCAYAEFYFTPVFWPAFDEQHFDTALSAYHQRVRRFGSVPEA